MKPVDPPVIRRIPLALIAWHSLSSFLLLFLARVQCHLLPPPPVPQIGLFPLPPTVEAGCLEAGECPSMPPEMSTLCPPTQRCSFCHSPQPLILLCPPSLPSSGMQQLLCELVPEVSFPLLPLPSFSSFSSSSPCEVLPARATRDTRVIMAVPHAGPNARAI